VSLEALVSSNRRPRRTDAGSGMPPSSAQREYGDAL